jgi:hypothetical protein
MPPYNQPDFEQILNLWWGGAFECSGWAAFQAAAANVIVGTNPPYTLSDFLAVYSKFFGTPTNIQIATTLGSTSAVVSGVPQGTTLTAGVFVNGPGVLGAGTTLLSVAGGGSVVLSLPALSTASTAPIQAYLTPWLPIMVIQMFINLALSSIQQLRWQSTWTFAMALFVAHYATLFMQTETQSPNLTASEIVTSGLQQGVIISQSAGDVSATVQPIQGFDAWGTLNQTEYGAQLITLAQIMGAGIMYIM